MALFFECMLLCAQKVLDTADIVREAMFRQLSGQAPSSPRQDRPRQLEAQQKDIWMIFWRYQLAVWATV